MVTAGGLSWSAADIGVVAGVEVRVAGVVRAGIIVVALLILVAASRDKCELTGVCVRVAVVVLADVAALALLIVVAAVFNILVRAHVP